MRVDCLSRKVVLKGKVFSGTKKGETYVNLPWVKKQVKEKLGFNPFAGTLNLCLSNPSGINKLNKADGITITPKKGYYTGKCFKALVNKKIEGAVVLPDVPDYPNNILEILAPVNLRKALSIKDGDNVEVTVTLE